ncbi:MAG: prepilin-type N-terminal cleavage/methylation protein [Candidatus Saccharibacteria bacterium]|nr:prepilin-type N-terminal cleavage/methylation protein [Candidatus Saccharibacteria bacterium]
MHRAAQKQTGFTIVELLIVIVVIGILAAITIVAYNGIQNRAKNSAALSAVNQTYKKVVSYAVVNNDNYPLALSAVGISDNDSTNYQYSVNNSSLPRTYCVTVTVGNVSYFQNNSTQTTPAPGGCPGHGQNGIAAITNLSLNPSASGSSSEIGEWSSRYAMARTWITGASDGPIPALTTYGRWTQGTAATGGGRGVDHRGNLDLTNPQVDATWPVTVGVPISVSTYLRSTIANSTARIDYRISDGSSTWLTATLACPSTNYSGTGTWIRLICTITPSATGYIQFSTRFDQSVTWTTGATLDVTGLMIVNSSNVPNYADGNSTNWIWNGSANSSTSTGPPL